MEGPRNVWLEALDYYRRGWSIIPIKPNDKKPSIKWGRYAVNRPSEAMIDKWFKGAEAGIGGNFGEVSGGLVSRDFDDRASYQTWAKQYPKLASTLPTVATSRGFHVYARACPNHIRDLRTLIGKPGATGAILVAGGELRCGPGCYSILPPSIHPSGHVYAWIVPLPDGPLPEVDLIQAGLYERPPKEKGRHDGKEFPPPSLPKGRREFPQPEVTGRSENKPCNREHRENGDYRGSQRLPRNTEAIVGADAENRQSSDAKQSDPRSWSESIQRAIIDSLPDAAGKRHRHRREVRSDPFRIGGYFLPIGVIALPRYGRH